ncbi:MAG: hypothetical protein WC155_07395 [Candidatus Cloacimonadales bacterium]
MHILSLLNSVVIPITRGKETYYFFLDSGCPYSISPVLTSLNQDDIGVDFPFHLDIHNSNIQAILTSISELLGITISGMLGLDFFTSFNNFLFDSRNNSLEFNLPKFDYDYAIGIINMGYLLTTISPINQNNEEMALIDTGAFTCMTFNDDLADYPISQGWKYPSTMGEMTVNFYNDIPLYLDHEMKGLLSFGRPTNLPAMPFNYVLGLNFLTQYTCLFDWGNNQLKLLKSNKPSQLNNTPSLTLGFQIKIINDEIMVSNILPNCNLDINIGDIISLPGLDMSNLERINEIYNRLIYLNDNKDVHLLVNGVEKVFTPINLFN